MYAENSHWYRPYPEQESWKSGDPKSGSCLVVPFIPNGLPFFARALGMLSSVEIVILAHLDLEAAAV